METYTISRDDEVYEAWPDLTTTDGNTLLCLFSECEHHNNRRRTRFVYTVSNDKGRTWAPKLSLTGVLDAGVEKNKPHWNCVRISTLASGKVIAIGDCFEHPGKPHSLWLWEYDVDGVFFHQPTRLPMTGVVPDKVLELTKGENGGRWCFCAHSNENGRYTVNNWISDDRGASWRGPFEIASQSDLLLCEGSIVELPSGELVCFMRENSQQRKDCHKSISFDKGETWLGPYPFPLPGCHRPASLLYDSDRLLIAYRFAHGGAKWGTKWQNTFIALTDVNSCLTTARDEAETRLFPLDYDHHQFADTGYCGMVKLDTGEIYVANYIMADAPRAYIKGYRLSIDEIFQREPQS